MRLAQNIDCLRDSSSCGFASSQFWYIWTGCFWTELPFGSPVSITQGFCVFGCLATRACRCSAGSWRTWSRDLNRLSKIFSWIFWIFLEISRNFRSLCRNHANFIIFWAFFDIFLFLTVLWQSYCRKSWEGALYFWRFSNLWMLWKLAYRVVMAFDSVVASFRKELLKAFPSWAILGSKRHDKFFFVSFPSLLVVLPNAPPSVTALPWISIIHMLGDCWPTLFFSSILAN